MSSPKRRAEHSPAMAPPPKRGTLASIVRQILDLSHREQRQLIALMQAGLDDDSAQQNPGNSANGQGLNGHAPRYANAQPYQDQEIEGGEDYPAQRFWDRAPGPASPASVHPNANKSPTSFTSDAGHGLSPATDRGGQFWASQGAPSTQTGHALETAQSFSEVDIGTSALPNTGHRIPGGWSGVPITVEDNSESRSRQTMLNLGHDLDQGLNPVPGSQEVEFVPATNGGPGHYGQNGDMYSPVQVTNSTAKAAKLELKKVQRELTDLIKSEGVKGIWGVESTAFVGKFFFTMMNYHLSNLQPGDWESWHLSQSGTNASKIANVRSTVLGHMRGLARRCGGLKAVAERNDACSEFLAVADQNFRFTEAEKRTMPAGHWFSFRHSFVIAKQAVGGQPTFLWTHPDTDVIAQHLLNGAKSELAQLKENNDALLHAGVQPTRCFGIFFGSQKTDQVKRLRDEVLSNCVSLATRRKGLNTLMARDDAARAYIVSAMDTFLINEQEMVEACRTGVTQQATAPSPHGVQGSPTKKSPRKPKSIEEHGLTLLHRLQKHRQEQEQRRKHLEKSGKCVSSGSFIDKNGRTMGAEEVEGYRCRAIKDCRSLASLCGGMDALRRRTDACGRFLELVIELFRVSDEELTPAPRTPPTPRTTTPSPPAPVTSGGDPYAHIASDPYAGMASPAALAHDPYAPKAEQQAAYAGPATASKMEPTVAGVNGAPKNPPKNPPATNGDEVWDLRDTGLLGTSLLKQVLREKDTQGWRRVEYLSRNGNRKLDDDAVISQYMTLETASEVQKRRQRVLNACQELVSRCGGLTKALMRSDDCQKFVELVMTDFKVAPHESGLWMR